MGESHCRISNSRYLPQNTGLSKAQQLKKSDPYGIGIAVLSMGIVFACLALLFIVFWVFGAT